VGRSEYRPNYESDDYVLEYETKEEAQKNIDEDVAAELQNRQNFKIVKIYNGIELYVPNSAIFHEWKLETMDEFILRMWEDFSEIPFDESDTSSGLVLSDNWGYYDVEFPKGTDRDTIWK
jgi:hypothetical protein